MSSGDWCKGKTKFTNARVAKMAENVSKALRDPILRERLANQKRLQINDVMQKLADSDHGWRVISNIEERYDTLTTRNIECECKNGHVQVLSVNDLLCNHRCITCLPTKNSGRLNRSYVHVNEFRSRLFQRFGERFSVNTDDYDGLNKNVEFTCNVCGTVFLKRPRVLLQEKHGCAQCARKAKSVVQQRTAEEFYRLERLANGDQYTYHPRPGQTYSNRDVIERTCRFCKKTIDQAIPGLLLSQTGCPICSQKRKHTTESFIEKATMIHGKDAFDYRAVKYVNNKVPVTITCKNGHTFQTTPSNHFGHGCPLCPTNRSISLGETEWLESLNIPLENRNVVINHNNRIFNVDGFINQTIYEYYGDFWHGNPKRFDPTEVHPRTHLTMHEHYTQTMEREQELRNAGYVVITMWESDWQTLRNSRRNR